MAARTKEIVIARYDEGVEWVGQYLPFVDRVTIYDKNDRDDFVEPFDRKVKIVRLPNVGREAHTYAHHFATNDLCDDVVCTQGRFSDHVSPIDFRNMVVSDDAVYGKVREGLDVPWDSTVMAHFGYTTHRNHAGSTPMMPAGMTMGEYYATYISDAPPPPGFRWVEGAIFKTNASKVRRFSVDAYEKIRATLETSSNPEAAHIMERFWGAMVF